MKTKFLISKLQFLRNFCKRRIIPKNKPYCMVHTTYIIDTYLIKAELWKQYNGITFYAIFQIIFTCILPFFQIIPLIKSSICSREGPPPAETKCWNFTAAIIIPNVKILIQFHFFNWGMFQVQNCQNVKKIFPVFIFWFLSYSDYPESAMILLISSRLFEDFFLIFEQ